MRLTWTPPNADPVLASVILQSPEAMTREDYLGRLAMRISDLVQAASEEERNAILPLAQAEGLDLTSLNPMQVGEILARDSEMLAMATEMDRSLWPIPVESLNRDPRQLEAIQAVTLEMFLTYLYAQTEA